MNSNIVTLSPDDIPRAKSLRETQSLCPMLVLTFFKIKALRCKTLTHSQTRDLVDISFGKMLRANTTNIFLRCLKHF